MPHNDPLLVRTGSIGSVRASQWGNTIAARDELAQPDLLKIPVVPWRESISEGVFFAG